MTKLKPYAFNRNTIKNELIYQEIKLIEYCEEVLGFDFSEFDAESWDNFEKQCKESIMNIYKQIKKEK